MMLLSVEDYHYIRDLVRESTAISLGDDKAYLAEVRLRPLASQEGCESIRDFVSRLRSTTVNGLHQKVVEAMTINETSFFRDVTPFDAIRKLVIPKLLEARKSERRLRIWSAACSSGQEPYSIAMILKETIPDIDQWDISIIATDVCTEVLERAQQGRYSQMEINRGVPAPMLIKHFQKQGLEWQLKPAIRDLADFRPLNLIGEWPRLPNMDIILLRNVMIYFEAAVKQRILERLSRLIRYDGYFFLGGAETLLNLTDCFERFNLDRAHCYRLRRPPWEQ